MSPDNTTVPVVADTLRDASYAIMTGAGDAQLQSVLDTIALMNRAVNGFVGLCILIGICAFFVYLVTWMFARPESPLEKDSMRGATRAFIVLFLIVNVWFLMRLIQYLIVIDPVIAALSFVFLIAILCFWSLLQFGAAVTAGVSALMTWSVDSIVSLLVPHTDGEQPQSKWRAGGLRLAVSVTLGVAITLVGLYLF